MEQTQFEIILQRIKELEDKITKLEEKPMKAYVMSSQIDNNVIKYEKINLLEVDRPATHTMCFDERGTIKENGKIIN